MSRFVRVSPSILTKESRTWPAILSAAPRGPLWMSANYAAYALEGYTWNADVYACVNATVRAFRGIDFGVYRQKAKGLEPVEDGPLFDLIKQPNPRQSWSALMGEWVGSLEISGNAYIEGVSPDNNSDKLTRPPRELFVLRPDRMFVIPGDVKIPIAGYEYRAGSAIVPYKAQMWRDPRSGGWRPRLPVMHSKYWNPLDDFYGLAPISPARQHVDSTNAAQAWNVSLLQNSARASGVFSTDVVLTSDQVDEYTNIIRQKFSGPGNAGRPMVLGSGYKWDQISLTPAEMDWLKSLDHNTIKVCSIYGIPPELIGDSSGRTYSNYQEARKAVYTEKWLPMLDMVCDDFNNWLTPLFYDVYHDDSICIGYDKDKIEAIQEDRQLANQLAVDRFNAGGITLNQFLEMIGEAAIGPNGDVYKISTTQMFVPQSQLGKTSTVALAPPPRNNQPPTDNEKPPKGKPAKKDDVSALFRETREQLRRLQ